MRRAAVAAAVVMLLTTRTRAQPVQREVEQAEVEPALDLGPTPVEPTRIRRSVGWALLESAGVLAAFNLGARAIGKEYVKISLDSIERNFTSAWVWDEDAFSTNQFGHPYMGSLYYAAARSNGFGVIASTAFAVVNSFVWELVMETETPSINDQYITPAAGSLIGEVLHRWSRSMLWRPPGHRPGLVRYVIATLLDPVGMLNRTQLHEAWQLVPPPPSFGWLAVGWSGLETALDATGGARVSQSSAVYGALHYTYGLPTDARFQPRGLLDHFDMRIEGAIGRDVATAGLRVRGMISGIPFGGDRVRAIAGLFGSYDFENAERVRVSTLALGPGTTLHAPLGERAFAQATLLASVIPFGTAGSDLPAIDRDRDYHRGPGGLVLGEVRLGWRGLGMLQAASTAYYIDGAQFAEGRELVSLTRFSALVALHENHALGLDLGFGVRDASFVDASDVSDRSAQVRLFYALIGDRDFGGGTYAR